MIIKTFDAKEIELKPKELLKALGRKLKETDYKAKAAEITTFDLRPALNDPELFEDGIHPTEEGHRIIADLVLKLIRPLINEF